MRRLSLILMAVLLGLLALAACEKDYVHNVTVVDECCPDCGRCDSTRDSCSATVDTLVIYKETLWLIDTVTMVQDTCWDRCRFEWCYWRCIEACELAGHAATCDCWRQCAEQCKCDISILGPGAQ